MQTINSGRGTVNQDPSAVAELVEDRVARISPHKLSVMGGYVLEELVNGGGMHLSSAESDDQESLLGQIVLCARSLKVSRATSPYFIYLPTQSECCPLACSIVTSTQLVQVRANITNIGH